MTTIFSGSRLANLRQKKNSTQQTNLKSESPFKFNLPQQEDSVAYQPSSSFHGKNNTRLLRGRIERGDSINRVEGQVNTFCNQNAREESSSVHSKPTLKLSSTGNEGLRLVINDEPPKLEEKRNSIDQPLKKTQKRILIAKEIPKSQNQNVHPQNSMISPQETKVLEPSRNDDPMEKPIVIKEEQVEESANLENQNELVDCPEGCGRKFNKMAVEKHAKACKIVFMSKRKQFNSQAKRITSKEQAGINKQIKKKQKKESLKGKSSKGFEKTGQNWKTASEDFRAAIKAIKKDQIEEQCEQSKEQQMKMANCQFCQKPFAEIFIEKHMQNCHKKKDEKKKTLKKK